MSMTDEEIFALLEYTLTKDDSRQLDFMFQLEAKHIEDTGQYLMFGS